MNRLSTGLQLSALSLVLAACALADCIPAMLGAVAAAGALEGAACIVGRGRA